MIRARSWNVSLRSAGPPTSRAWRSMPPKSSPPEPVVATGAPSIALGISARLPSPGDPAVARVIEELESFHGRFLRRSLHGCGNAAEGGDDDRSGTADRARATSRQARERIAGTVLRTPLVRLELGERPGICLKLENLQPTNAYKIRGAANAVAKLSDEERAQRRVDDQRRQCRAGRRLCRARGSASPAPWWPSRPRRRPSSSGCGRWARRSFRCPTKRPGRRPRRMPSTGSTGTFIHPFDNHDFIAGHGTMGLEILEDCAGRAHGHLPRSAAAG